MNVLHECRFTIGARVTANSFTDSSGKRHVAIDGLVVERIQLIQSIEFDTMLPHYRIKAVVPNGFGYFEASERFFS